LTHLLACAFGTPPWVAGGGGWVEVPLLVTVLPPQWDRGGGITIIIQMANVGPPFVTRGGGFRPGLLKEVAVPPLLVWGGGMACLLLSFLWNHTSVIAGKSHSIAFLILTFFLSLVDCTSSVTFLPFMMQLHPPYTTRGGGGEGLSGLIPALPPLGQGGGGSSCANVSSEVNPPTGNGGGGRTIFQLETQYLPPKFSRGGGFLLMTAMMLTCPPAFFWGGGQPKVWELSQQQLFPSNIVLNSFDQIADEAAGPPLNSGGGGSKDPKRPGDILPPKVSWGGGKLTFIYLLITCPPSLTRGGGPSVQSYSCLPYGHTAYHLAATLSSMANPLACPPATLRGGGGGGGMGFLTTVGTGFGAYNMAIAVMSPCPLLQQSPPPDAIGGGAWVLFTGTLTYPPLMAGGGGGSRSRSALVWYPPLEQLGGGVGALLMFPLVNPPRLFKGGGDCSLQCP
ncbi:S52A3 protein, partial [Piprites chloris]|nr:S52A3 protein [Piprites chloris]